MAIIRVLGSHYICEMDMQLKRDDDNIGSFRSALQESTKTTCSRQLLKNECLI